MLKLKYIRYKNDGSFVTGYVTKSKKSDELLDNIVNIHNKILEAGFGNNFEEWNSEFFNVLHPELKDMDVGDNMTYHKYICDRINDDLKIVNNNFRRRHLNFEVYANPNLGCQFAFRPSSIPNIAFYWINE